MSSSNASTKNTHYGRHSADTKKPMLERMVDGELYLCNDPSVYVEIERAENWLSRFNSSLLLSVAKRNEILRERIGQLGEGSAIRPPFFCDYGRKWEKNVLVKHVL
uniref:Mac domain-containing protein n=1 Tax=Globodera pallida TaxID=36090 RepID=A0A183BI32_GLOPA